MAKTVTLAQLITDVRLWSDNRTGSSGSEAITDTEITRLLNLHLGALHGKMAALGSADFPLAIAQDTITLAGGTASYALPDDFLSAVSVELAWATTEREIVRSLNHYADAYKFRSMTWGQWGSKRFRIVGNQITFYPTPAQAVDAILTYVPTFADLADDADTWDGINGWEKLVTLGAALDVMSIQARPTGNIAALYTDQANRVDAELSRRQDQDPQEVRITERLGVGFFRLPYEADE